MEIDYTASSEYFAELLKIMNRLRDKKNGCPWDNVQTRERIIVNLIEETYEVVDAILKKEFEHLKEELGDLLMQIVFQAQFAAEEDIFTIQDVIKGISDKLVRRHPHIFGNVRVSGVEDVLLNWENIKETEHSSAASRLDGVPKSMPALARAFRIQEKVARFGFDWHTAEDVIPKLKEETQELADALKNTDTAGVEEEIGDFLFTIVNYSRHLNIEPETALTKSINKFISRFKKMEKLIKNDAKKLDALSLSQLDEYWEKVK